MVTAEQEEPILVMREKTKARKQWEKALKAKHEKDKQLRRDMADSAVYELRCGHVLTSSDVVGHRT